MEKLKTNVFLFVVCWARPVLGTSPPGDPSAFYNIIECYAIILSAKGGDFIHLSFIFYIIRSPFFSLLSRVLFSFISRSDVEWGGWIPHNVLYSTLQLPYLYSLSFHRGFLCILYFASWSSSCWIFPFTCYFPSWREVLISVLLAFVFPS